MKEKEKMGLQVWYDPNNDEQLCKEREEAEKLYLKYNNTSENDTTIKKQLLPHCHPTAAILKPMYTDYGYNCYIGEETFINHESYLMDGAKITIGEHCYIGPYFGCYTAEHPLLFEERNLGYERARPITIGKNCWIGASVTVLPGVTIGEGSVIGAGSIVNKDIPENVVAVGNPCKVIRKITEKDSIFSNDTK